MNFNFNTNNEKHEELKEKKLIYDVRAARANAISAEHAAHLAELKAIRSNARHVEYMAKFSSMDQQGELGDILTKSPDYKRRRSTTTISTTTITTSGYSGKRWDMSKRSGTPGRRQRKQLRELHKALAATAAAACQHAVNGHKCTWPKRMITKNATNGDITVSPFDFRKPIRVIQARR
jgi:hypothetical protein